MKNLLKLFAVVLIAALFLVSCSDKGRKGGTIQITNGTGYPDYFIVVEGKEFLKALEDLKNGDGTLINTGATETLHYDKDGFYTVTALNPLGFYEFVFLALGNTEKVTIKDKK